MPEQVEARRCIVTGAGSGLGQAMTLGLAQAGNIVVAADINVEGLEETARLGAAYTDRVRPYRVDLRREECCRDLVEQTIADLKGVDVLVNCAGLNMALFSADFLTKIVRFWEVDPDKWQCLYDVNVRAPFLLSRSAAPHMMQQGWGRIINITTSFATMLREGNTPYGQAKAALEAASAGWAQELECTGVTCNILIPGGAADTPMIPKHAPVDRAKLVAPAAMVPPLVYLSSKRSDGFNGRRIIAAQWRPGDTDEANIERAASPAGWPELGAQSGAPTRGSVAQA
jgi:NAD(P)-dependent dehydrogenase (short-subunit alcohol dehydrogenase family)